MFTINSIEFFKQKLRHFGLQMDILTLKNPNFDKN